MCIDLSKDPAWTCCGSDCSGGVALEEGVEESLKEDKKFAVEEALDLICGPRMEFYGPPWENLQDIADTWTPYIRRALEQKGGLNATDVCQLMILLKAIRQVRGYHRDSAVDIAGYTELAEVINEAEQAEKFVKRAFCDDPDKAEELLKERGEKMPNTPEPEHITDGRPCWCNPKIIKVGKKGK